MLHNAVLISKEPNYSKTLKQQKTGDKASQLSFE
jgi:hypothetical protein